MDRTPLKSIPPQVSSSAFAPPLLDLRVAGTRSFFAQWILLVFALFILGGFIAINSDIERKNILVSAQDRLSRGAEVATSNVERRLRSIDRALKDLRTNLPHLRSDQHTLEHLAMNLEFFQNGIEGVHAAMILDAKGTVTAASRPSLVGLNDYQRAYFQSLLLSKPDPLALYISEPFETEHGTHSLNVFHAIIDARGEFSGIVAATLDAGDFRSILTALRYAPDISVGLIHASGQAFLSLSSQENAQKAEYSDPHSFFSRHLRSGTTHSFLSGNSPILPGERLAAVQTINPAQLSMTAPLVIVVSQELNSLLAPWRSHMLRQYTLFMVLAGLAALSLFFHQRRQRGYTLLMRSNELERQADIDRLTLATEISGAGVWELNLKTNALVWDEAMFRLYGKERENFSSGYDAWQESVFPEDLPEAEADFRQAIDQGVEFDTLFRIRRGDGEIRIIDARAKVYRDESGQPARMIGVNRDITNRQRLEQSLRENTEFVISILDSLDETIAVLDTDGVIVRVNRAWREFAANNGASGPAQDAIGLNYLTVCSAALAHDSGAEAREVLEGIREVLAGKRSAFRLEYPCHSPTEQRWFVVHVTPLCGALSGAVVAHENITSRKRAEQLLSRSLQMTQQFLDHLPGTAFVKDENLRVVMANQAFQSLLGMNPDEMIGKSNTELFPNDFGRKLDEDDRRVMDAGQTTVIEESFDGRFFETNKFVIQGDGGKKLLGGITMEVTQRQKLIVRQAALLKIGELGGTLPEAQFLQQGLEMIERLTLSQIGFIHFVNDDQESIELVAWTGGALKGCTAVHEGHYPLAEAGIWADCARTRSIVIFNDYAGYRAKKGLPEGHAPLHRLISVPIIEEGRVRLILGVGNKDLDYDDDDGSTAQIIGNDLWRIVRRVRAEAELKRNIEELRVLNARLDESNNKLLQSEKLASLGQLAAGVAHEINNPIGYVSSNLNSLSAYVDDLLTIETAYEEIEDHFGRSMPHAFNRVHQLKRESDFTFLVGDIRHLLDESREGLERVRKIVKDLKDFSRAGDSGWQRFDLHQGMESTLNIVWNEIKYKAEIDREFGDLPEIFCIPSQINQVFMNLLTNAAQAIEEHGHIVLRSGREETTVWIEIEDDGAGIATEDLDHIFEPFYTTKPVGKGTGLGLSVSWSIIQRHHGAIEVRSVLGQGTTFRITLPIDQKQDVEPSVEADS